MEIEEVQVDGVSILHLKGRLLICDQTPEGEFLGETVERLVKAGRKKIALDLTGVPFVDSAGLGEIVRCYTIVTRHNGKFKLLNIPKRIRNLLSTARLDQVIGDDNDERPS